MHWGAACSRAETTMIRQATELAILAGRQVVTLGAAAVRSRVVRQGVRGATQARPAVQGQMLGGRRAWPFARSLILPRNLGSSRVSIACPKAVVKRYRVAIQTRTVFIAQVRRVNLTLLNVVSTQILFRFILTEKHSTTVKQTNVYRLVAQRAAIVVPVVARRRVQTTIVGARRLQGVREFRWGHRYPT